MGKIACECGYIHSDTCGYDGALLTYIEWEDEITKGSGWDESM